MGRAKNVDPGLALPNIGPKIVQPKCRKAGSRPHLEIKEDKRMSK